MLSIPDSHKREELPAARAELIAGLSRGYLSAALLVDPPLILELDGSLRAQGPYGISKEVHRVGLAVDDVEALRTALRARGVAL
jgi:hypothetical protein